MPRDRRKLYLITLWIQGIYTFLTAQWGLLDIDSFMRVSGPGTAIWLVTTVWAILLAALTVFVLPEAGMRHFSRNTVILLILSKPGLALLVLLCRQRYHPGHVPAGRVC